MSMKKKELMIIKRSFVWILYLYSGYILYLKEEYLFSRLITFAKVIYPLSIFWLQIRIKRSGKFLPIDSNMKTSQLWFNLLPVLASFSTVVLSILNTTFYLIDKFI